ncbi:MAG: Ig domain-containing protein [Nitrospirota bacterium]
MPKVVLILVLLIVMLSSCEGSKDEQLSKGIVKEKEAESGEVPKGSSPEAVSATPEIASIKLLPSSPNVNDTIKAEVLTKNNASASFEWEVNGKRLAASENSFFLGELKRGDKISLTVTPFIGNRKGKSLTVITHVFNAPPRIVSDIKDSKYKGRKFVYHVKASDADEDSLTYALKSSPEGMTINSETGLIQWNVLADFRGKVPVTVSVSDGKGGEVVQYLNIDIRGAEQQD